MNIRSITKVISNTLVGIVFQLTFSQSTMAAEVYHYVPHFTPQVTTPPTTPSHLSLISDPNEWTIPVGTNACYSWHMGSITNNLGSGSFGWATGFYPPVANQLQSTTSDSGFQSYDDERGIYIATTDPSANGVLDIQCGKYYGQAQAFYPWDYGSSSILKHGVTFKMPEAWHSNSANKKFYAVMYLRVSERGVTWNNPQAPAKGFWLQIRIVEGRGFGEFDPTGYQVFPDVYTSHPVIDIEKSSRSGLIWSNTTLMQTTQWSDYKYFEYTISRAQIAQIVSLVNPLQEPGNQITTNPDNIMVFAVGTSPEVHVTGGEQSVVGAAFKQQYVRTEY